MGVVQDGEGVLMMLCYAISLGISTELTTGEITEWQSIRNDCNGQAYYRMGKQRADCQYSNRMKD